MRIFSSCSAVVLTRCVRSSSSFSWAAASPPCVTSGDSLNPGKCVRDDVVLAGNVADVYGELRDESRWLNCRGEHLSFFWLKAKVSGLWSVRMV